MNPLNAKVEYEKLNDVFMAVEKLYNETFVNMKLPNKTKKELQDLKLKAHELKKTMEV